MDDERVIWGIGTSRTVRAHWAMIELGLDYHTVVVRTRTPDTEAPDFVRLNPRQKIPVLKDGPVVIAESTAIVTYLAETYRDGPETLIPDGSAARARYFEWMSFISMELDATSLYVLRRHWALPHIYGDSAIANKASGEYFERMINSAATLYDADQPFLLGAAFTGADILMTSTLDWAIDYKQPLPDIFLAYRDRISKRSGYAAAQTANNPQ